MEPRREQGIADLRGAPRKSRATSNRFADDDLRSQNQQLRELISDLETRLASRTAQLNLLSHEVRSPLQAVFGYTELLDAEIHGKLNESQRRYVHKIQQSQQHLLGLIDTILEYAMLESGQQIDATLRQTPVQRADKNS